jgi:hypothetical protein
MKRIIYTAVAAAAVLTGSVAAAAPALASTGPGSIQAVTHSAQHVDTTSAAGSATQDSPNGPVWAYDNLTEQFTVSHPAPDAYHVDVQVSGSFQGFADPRMASEGSADPGGPLTSAGSVRGTISYDVTSPVGPQRALLPAQEPDGTGLHTALDQLFNGQATSVVPGSYDFRYNQVGGAPYEQVG